VGDLIWAAGLKRFQAPFMVFTEASQMPRAGVASGTALRVA